jgi:hypothetical protein
MVYILTKYEIFSYIKDIGDDVVLLVVMVLAVLERLKILKLSALFIFIFGAYFSTAINF